MHRQDLRNKLSVYRAKWPEEHEEIDRYQSFVDAHEDCFERSLQIGHVTGSAWVVNQAGTHVLLTHHRKLNKWLQLGGHADGNPDVLAVALREAEEESGLPDLRPVSSEIFDLDIHLIPARKSDPDHNHFDVRFAFQAMGSDRYVVSAESRDLIWAEIALLQEVTTEKSMLRMASKWLNREV